MIATFVISSSLLKNFSDSYLPGPTEAGGLPSAAAIARSVRSSQEGEGEEQEAREDIRGFRQWTSGMQEDLLVMRNVLVQEDPALDTSSSPPGRPSRSRSRRRRLGGPSPHPWPVATDQDYSYSEVHQASFSHHLSFLCFNFYIIMLSGPTVCDCPRTSVNGMNE